jgi:arylsulfatase A-like enzyme
VIAPHLNALAQQAVVFDRCSAASFPTVPARADIMTGRFTFTYLDWGPLPQAEITLAQCLSAASYLTFGVADTPFLLRNGYGLDRGFADFEWVKGQRSGLEHDDVIRRRRSEADYFAPMTFRIAADWLEQHHRDRFFLYIDTWDPHEPWDPPDYYVKPYFPDYAGEQVGPNYWDWRADGLSERDLEIAHACYCGEITMVDHWFGFLMQRLERFGLLENTAVLFTSDHGFYFGERGQFGKRRFRWPGGLALEEGFARGLTMPQGQVFRSPLHNEITRVPLLASIPGVRPGRASSLCSLPDLMPTLLQLAGAPVPDRVQAASLLPAIAGDRDAGADLIVTSAPFEEAGRVSRTVDDLGRQAVEVSPSTISDGEWDLLYAMEGEPYELYRSQEDPAHQTDLAAQRRDVADALRARFVAWLQRQGVAERLITPRLRL